jgi:hypothetical protein
MEYNLNRPIFMAYINVDGMGAQRAEEKITEFMRSWTHDLQLMILGVKNGQETKVELLWRGNPAEQARMESNVFNDVNKKLNVILTLIEDGVSDEAIKRKLRSIQLTGIFKWIDQPSKK